MATAPLKDTAKMSFARVAASGGKDNASFPSFAKVAATGPGRELRKQPSMLRSENEALGEVTNGRRSTPSDPAAKTEHIQSSAAGQPAPTSVPVLTQQLESGNASIEDKLVDAVKALHVQDPSPTLVVNGSTMLRVEGNSTSDTRSPEDPYQRADSASEFGTKPPSLDGKSITSGTTFALDEKESLRPDDSASVKAQEDDDTFSGRGSIVAGSRMGSEAAARAYRSQFYETIERRPLSTSQEPPSQEINTPQSGSSGQQIVDGSKPKPLDGSSAPNAFNLFYRQTPDEKLIDALDSPKDRLFLLRLETQVIEFVKDSKEPFIDLPPCNSFCRMLTHKLADYYHMTHQVDPVAGAVRIFRTPFCRLPAPLRELSNPPTSNNTPPPIPTMKIMRRGEDGGTGPSPSKTTSENGSENKEKATAAKEKLSREDREAKYAAARERIFGRAEKNGENGQGDGESSNDMSRSSSVSTKDRSSQNRRGKSGKQRRDDSESFDSRSKYTAWFPAPAPQPSWSPSHYGPVPVQQRYGPVQPSYQSMPPTPYNNAGQPFNQGVMPVNNMMQYNPMIQYGQQPYQTHSAPITTYGSPNQHQHPQQWAGQNAYQPPYQPRPMPGGPPIPYPYGQLPSIANPTDPKSQHPIPGSFNRHAFNPKTQSFVPGGSPVPQQQPMSHHGSPHMSYNGYVPQQQQYSNGVGYNMTRQGSNMSSLPSYPASPHMSARPMMPQSMSGGGPTGNHLPNYGNAATLPPKPPPTA